MQPELLEKSLPEKRVVSIRKIEANRQNAQKSTGPKTARGKMYSRRNAIKHSLFVRDFVDLEGGEDWEELDQQYKRLLDEWQPVGPLEQLCVERITISWVRLQRLWRYENVLVGAAYTYSGCLVPDETRSAELSLLYRAEKEAEVSGQASRKTLEQIEVFNRSRWSLYEEAPEEVAKEQQRDIVAIVARERKIPIKKAKALFTRDPTALPEYNRFLAVETIRTAIEDRKLDWERTTKAFEKDKSELTLIPSSDEVNKITRYASAVDRELHRSLDLLERLQRRRKGEPVPPPLSVHLTQCI
jgi:hypothetical protein